MRRLCLVAVGGMLASVGILVSCTNDESAPELPERASPASTEELSTTSLVERMNAHFHAASTIRQEHSNPVSGETWVVDEERRDDGTIVVRQEALEGSSASTVYLLHCSPDADRVHRYQSIADSGGRTAWEVTEQGAGFYPRPGLATEFAEGLFLDAAEVGVRTEDGVELRGLETDQFAGSSVFWLDTDDRLVVLELDTGEDPFTIRFGYDVPLDIQLPNVDDPPSCG